MYYYIDMTNLTNNSRPTNGSTGTEIVPSDINGKVDIMRLAHSRLPLNQYGLPTQLFRPDLLTNIEHTKDEDWDAAIIEVAYGEGFPTVNKGIPIWEKLDFEPLDAFKLFHQYVKSLDATKGMRSLYELSMQIQDANEGILALESLHDMFFIYYWPQRVRAFDLFHKIVQEKARENRALTLEETHYAKASSLLDIAFNYMLDDSDDSEFQELMTPDLALKAAKFATSLQRLSSGLPINGPKDESKTQIELSLRSIQQEAVTEAPEENLRAAIRGDVETTKIAQELIIKMSTGR